MFGDDPWLVAGYRIFHADIHNKSHPALSCPCGGGVLIVYAFEAAERPRWLNLSRLHEGGAEGRAWFTGL